MGIEYAEQIQSCELVSRRPGFELNSKESKNEQNHTK